MNNINRGVLIGLRISLEQIAETLSCMADREWDKEDGTADNVPTAFQGEHSGNLYQAAASIREAIDQIRAIVPQNADFEE